MPNIHFAGTITMGAAGLKKNGVGGTGAVQGARYNARILARSLAERHFGVAVPREVVAPGAVVDRLLEEASDAPELWNQKGYLARVVLAGPDGPYDDGILPLQAFVDGDGADGAAMTLEGDADGSIRPVAYIRRGGAISEVTLDPEPLHDFRSSTDGRRRLSEALRGVLP